MKSKEREREIIVMSLWRGQGVLIQGPYIVHAGSLPCFIGTLKWNGAIVNVINYTGSFPA